MWPREGACEGTSDFPLFDIFFPHAFARPFFSLYFPFHPGGEGGFDYLLSCDSLRFMYSFFFLFHLCFVGVFLFLTVFSPFRSSHISTTARSRISSFNFFFPFPFLSLPSVTFFFLTPDFSCRHSYAKEEGASDTVWVSWSRWGRA